ncbi:MAG: homoserine O-acetyltransferase [Clostridia bacterium]|nr:homoserine O-acetyltransferase [Clostridia bacterium]
MFIHKNSQEVITRPETFSFGAKADPFLLENGEQLTRVDVTYETCGTLNPARDNVILIEHALTGSAQCAGKHSPEEKTVGWWDPLIGPGKAFDTGKYFIVCANVLGGCYGTTGPASINPETGEPYGMDFPTVTIRDMVKVQKKLLEHLGISKLKAVAGGSMGGMQVLEWAVTYPEWVEKAICIAASGWLYPQAIAFNEVGRRAIMIDPKWQGGRYYPGKGPVDGLAVARMIGTITYKSDESMNHRFGRKLCSEDPGRYFCFDEQFEVESYLHYHGSALVKRFDANCYLYLTKAMDLHDVSYGYDSHEAALSRIQAGVLVMGISSDILFPTYQQKEIVEILRKCAKKAQYFELNSPHGHDGFLIEFEQIGPVIQRFLNLPS